MADTRSRARCGLQVEVPQLTRCAGCAPLRPALVLWGALQAATVVVLIILSVVRFFQAMHRHHYDVSSLVLVLLLSLAVSAADVAAAVLLAVGARGDKPRLLNVCYQFYAVKVCGYALLLLLSVVLHMSYGWYADTWYYWNLDDVRYFLLVGCPAAGVLDLLFQLYLWVLVRSQVLSLGATPRLTPFRIRIQVLYADDAAEHLHDREHEHLDKHDEKAGLHCVE